MHVCVCVGTTGKGDVNISEKKITKKQLFLQK